jgi:hypothetical protein
MIVWLIFSLILEHSLRENLRLFPLHQNINKIGSLLWYVGVSRGLMIGMAFVMIFAKLVLRLSNLAIFPIYLFVGFTLLFMINFLFIPLGPQPMRLHVGSQAYVIPREYGPRKYPAFGVDAYISVEACLPEISARYDHRGQRKCQTATIVARPTGKLNEAAYKSSLENTDERYKCIIYECEYPFIHNQIEFLVKLDNTNLH